MTNDCIAQSWYRFIHSLGNPVELCRPALVSQTQHFYQYAIVAENVIDPTHHPCLSALPGIFLKSMKGVAAMVDAYLGKHAINCIYEEGGFSFNAVYCSLYMTKFPPFSLCSLSFSLYHAASPFFRIYK
jgi:hypothetical protein